MPDSNSQSLQTPITRRDFLAGAGGALITTLGTKSTPAVDASPARPAPASLSIESGYPPALNGIRGQTEMAMAAAHGMREAASGSNFLLNCRDTGEEYDLVVVGAGMSGLSAAYFFRKELPESRVLILDECDDIGGHARRNEFRVDGKLLVGIGGTYAVALPETYTSEGKALLADIGLDAQRYYAETAADSGLFDGIQFKTAVFFDRETYGVDVLIDRYPEFVPWWVSDDANPDRANLWRKFLDRSPLSERARRDLRHVMEDSPNGFHGKSVADIQSGLRKISYLNYLREYFEIGPDASLFVQKIISGFRLNVGAGPDSFSAYLAHAADCPGFSGLHLPPRRLSAIRANNRIGGDIRLPDGNAGIARLLARWLIPESLPGKSMEDSVHTPLRMNQNPGSFWFMSPNSSAGI